MALILLRQIDEMTKIAIWKIEESSDELVAQLQLNESELSLLPKLKKGKRTLHWLASRALLRHLLQTKAPIYCPSDENGKPYLPDYPYKISFTHSFDYAGIMMSKQKECGIDLELIHNKILRIKEKFMKPSELQGIDEKNIEQLYACWCAKEAVYKLQGKKGVSFLNNMSILPFSYSAQNGSLTLVLHKNDTSTPYTVYYEKFENYMLGYVV
ncbi:4'-phosphopantetheinyl transferase superfamily protein [Sphingobacterium sp. UT-1RO-CII-1]|uniref:4'-phosphopantetheinyl transferase family protein n=1 Tax=Sphingobacterium sp. UT-1RO-CII-1 TaxID=2995225 RepID=UPI00227AB60C|nr:4'-phosphopantetheinyl transferase superfamily protein [Sphingobacterium sp. UT-1RO-CII-1]MCY4778490.1 4'-phosphopantetheinyl transferase superfamily protein [Sphingobacterium sp. UT-1RO-CII-1]